MKVLLFILITGFLIGSLIAASAEQARALSPSERPSLSPSPSERPSLSPSLSPSQRPSLSPSLSPSQRPSLQPTGRAPLAQFDTSHK